jgi:hypothetical protein
MAMKYMLDVPGLFSWEVERRLDYQCMVGIGPQGRSDLGDNLGAAAERTWCSWGGRGALGPWGLGAMVTWGHGPANG